MPKIEIVYGLANTQKLYRLEVADGTTAREAILQHIEIKKDFPGADLNAPLGIFGKVVRDDTILRENDRIELYRPLLVNPKDARRKRVQDKKSS